MTALDVSVNGRHVCVAGIGNGVLAAHVTRTGNDRNENIRLAVGGLEGGHYLDWLMPSVGVGDEVTIRIVDVPTTDPPTTRELPLRNRN